MHTQCCVPWSCSMKQQRKCYDLDFIFQCSLVGRAAAQFILALNVFVPIWMSQNSEVNCIQLTSV